MPKFKPGVVFWNMHPKIIWALEEIDKIHKEMAASELCTVTAARDSDHMKGSLHYEGRAVDIRTRTIYGGDKQYFKDKVKAALGEGFDVVLESDHLHVEWDPK